MPLFPLLPIISGFDPPQPESPITRAVIDATRTIPAPRRLSGSRRSRIRPP
jgi:hypothetical protein